MFCFLFSFKNLIPFCTILRQKFIFRSAILYAEKNKCSQNDRERVLRVKNEYGSKDRIPSRGVTRACGGLVESVKTYPYTAYMEIAAGMVGKDWDAKEREKLAEAIKLNLINQKEYPFEMLQRKYQLPCSRKIFRRESRLYVKVLSGLCGFE